MAVICIGSDVPGDWFEHGHFIIAGTEQGMFPRVSESTYSHQRRYFKRRCYLCASTRRYWLRSTDATTKATKTHRDHALKMVKFGFAPDIATAVAVMNANGVTIPWIAQSALDAIGKPCPGRCFQGVVVYNQPKCEDHVITEWGDLWFDWRDTDSVLSRENCGWLCPSCNKQKGRHTSWARFMQRQHAIRQNFLHGKRMHWQPGLFDEDEDGVA